MKYVFLTTTIYGIGGAELYLRSKMKYVSSIGYKPVVIYYNQIGEVYIKEFYDYAYCVKEIAFPPCYYNIFHRRRIQRHILNIIHGDSETIIESHLTNFSLWGEMIAQNLKCKHVLYFLAEKYPIYNKSIYKFLEFKWSRKEIAGINVHSMQLIFGKYKKITEEENYYLKAWEGNNVEDIDSSLNNIVALNADVKIGCIGRLEKIYIRKTITSVLEYCNNHKDINIQLILIGGSLSSSIIQEYKDEVKNSKNLLLTFTGYVYPVPLKLLKKLSFIVAGSGAVHAPAFNHILTVAMDTDGVPIGLYGITTKNIHHRTEADKDSEKLHDYIDRIRSGWYNPNEIILKEESFFCTEASEAFASHMKFIMTSASTLLYYSTNHVGKWYLAFLFRLVGKDLYEKLDKFNQKRKTL